MVLNFVKYSVFWKLDIPNGIFIILSLFGKDIIIIIVITTTVYV